VTDETATPEQIASHKAYLRDEEWPHECSKCWCDHQLLQDGLVICVSAEKCEWRMNTNELN